MVDRLVNTNFKYLSNFNLRDLVSPSESYLIASFFFLYSSDRTFAKEKIFSTQVDRRKTLTSKEETTGKLSLESKPCYIKY